MVVMMAERKVPLMAEKMVVLKAVVWVVWMVHHLVE